MEDKSCLIRLLKYSFEVEKLCKSTIGDMLGINRLKVMRLLNSNEQK